MTEPGQRTPRQASGYNNRSGKSTNGSSRLYNNPPSEPYSESEEEFFYPQEFEDPLSEVAAPAYERRNPINIPPPVEPSNRTRRTRSSRPMPRRLSEELEDQQNPIEDEPEIPAKPRARRRSAKQVDPGEQIELKLKTPAKKPDTDVKKRQALGVFLVVIAIFILLSIVSYSAQDAPQAETKISDLPAIFLRSDPVVNANADTVHNWVGLIGTMIANFLINKTIGYAAIIFPFFMGWWSLALFRFSAKQRKRLTLATSFMLISAVLFSATIGTTQLITALPHLDREWSGAVGQFLGLTFTRLIGSIGALIIYATSFVVMLVFAIDLDIELTFQRVRGGYSGIAAKSRLKLIEFWDKREAKRAERLERKEQRYNASEITDETIASYDEDYDDTPIAAEIATEPEVVIKKAQVVKPQIAKPIVETVTQPKENDLEEPIAHKQDLNPARDIITVRQNGTAKQNGSEAPYLKIRPAPKSANGVSKQIPRIGKQSDEMLGEKASAMSRLSAGGTGIPTASRAVRILPSDMTEEVAKPASTPEIPKAVVPSLPIEEPITQQIPEVIVEIGDEKVLSNEALPHSKAIVEDVIDIPAIVAPPLVSKLSQSLFPSDMGPDFVPENPYNENLSKYRSPSLELLTPSAAGDEVDTDNAELTAKGTILRDKLAQFGVEIENIVVTPGPVVTLYEFTPADGVKVSTVGNLTDDIALAMKARGIRIIAPMPGRGTIGIEIPNDHPKMVSMRSVLENPAFINSKMNLPLALGKTISGDVYIDDLSKMPHLLIAGATGAGKSVGVNGILTSLLYSKSPKDVKFVIVDPKKIELSLYRALKDHFLITSAEIGEEIVTTPAYAVLALQACVIEMEKRYDRLAKAAVRSLTDYNLKVAQGKLKSTQSEQHYHLPYIVVIIDELADLMITAGKDIEEPICRLAQMARAVGIHLILATQRPSVDVITGVIKANFPARIAYQVATKVDSRTILDSMGAEQLLGNGDMLYLPSGTPKPIRLQAPYISTDEVEAIVEAVANQKGPGCSYSRQWRLPSLKQKGGGGSYDEGDLDPMFQDAAKCVFQNKSASTSMLQRRLKVGYSRAARMVDELERVGIVGPPDGAKAREVLITSQEELRIILENFI